MNLTAPQVHIAKILNVALKALPHVISDKRLVDEEFKLV